MLLKGVEQRDRLEAVPGRSGSVLLDATGVDGVLDRRHDQAMAGLTEAAVAKLDHLGKVVAGVHVQDREGERQRPERLLGRAQQHHRVLATTEQEHRPLELRGHLADHEHRLGLELAQVRDVTDRGHAARARSWR